MVRQRITTITQESVELPGTLRSNLQLPADGDFPVVQDDDMIAALAQVDLWEDLATKGGLDAELADLQLSVGEKQLVSFARAIVHHKHTRSKLALMDEITSQVDAEIEEKMCALIKDIFDECTMIIVSHRGKIMEEVDAMATLKDGYLESFVEWTAGAPRSLS